MRSRPAFVLAAIALLAVGFPSTGATRTPEADEEDSIVYYALDPQSIGEGNFADPQVVERMVNSLICALTGKPTAGEAWASLIKPGDVVGLKVSAGPGRAGGTKPAVVEAVARGLHSAGLSKKQIIVWDRNKADLLAAGYHENSPLYTLKWVDPREGGYDEKAIVTAPIVGRLIWGDSSFGDQSTSRFNELFTAGDQLSSTSHYARILSREVTKVINLPSATDSFLTGIHGAIANMTLSNIDNWRRFGRAPEHGDPYIAELYADEMIRGKVVLTILDALILQYAGGPYPNPNFTTDNGAIFLSTDPVALDATLLEMLEEWRKAAKLPPLSPMTKYLDSAHWLGLGNQKSSRIKTHRVGTGPAR